jgi:hypothetical protein
VTEEMFFVVIGEDTVSERAGGRGGSDRVDGVLEDSMVAEAMFVAVSIVGETIADRAGGCGGSGRADGESAAAVSAASAPTPEDSIACAGTFVTLVIGGEPIAAREGTSAPVSVDGRVLVERVTTCSRLLACSGGVARQRLPVNC